MKKNKILEWLKNNRTLTMPVMSFPLVKQTKYNVDELVTKAEVQEKLLSMIINTYPISASLGIMDLSVEAEAFGSEINFHKNKVPTVTKSLVASDEDIQLLDVPNPYKERTNEYIKGIELYKILNPRKTVIASVIGPFSLAGRLMDMSDLMVDCCLKPDYVNLLLEKTTEFIIRYIKAFKEHGADGVLISEPTAGLLSPVLCHNFSNRYIKKIISAVNDEHFIIGYHNCGNAKAIVKEIIQLNVDFYHFGDAIEIEDMLEIIPNDRIIMGNISPSHFLENYPVTRLYQEVSSLLNRCSKYPNFIISTGCDLPYEATEKHIETYFKAIDDFYKVE